MKEYIVKIKETSELYVRIMASSPEEAEEKAVAGWESGEYSLGPEEFKSVDFDVLGGD